MGAQKKGSSRVSDDHEAHVTLQAILLADSFATTFRPITQERPKVLLPLVNAPMIDYTLTWLESAGVEEVFVFCCAHSGQVIDYLKNSQWRSHSYSSVRTVESLENSEHPNFSVWTIESHGAISAGDALRLIYEQNVIPDDGDFVLISGDTVSNMSLTKVLLEHRERKQKDRNAVMTMVIKRSKPSQITHQSRLGSDEIFMAIDPDTKQLLYYEDKADDSKESIYLDKLLLADRNSISLHNDIQDCYIDICSQEVLSLFTDNFDYQHLRRHFVKGLLHDDIMDYKIFTHEIHSSYAARLDNFRSYDTISKDVIQRWMFPFVPEFMSAIKLERKGMYRASDIKQSHSANIGPLTVIGRGTNIGNKTSISNSVVGEACMIGSNVSIEGSYLWNNVTIEDGCKLRHAIVCDGVVIKSGAVLEPGVVLSFKVVIGQQFIVPSYSMVSLFKQPVKQDSDEELEYADHSTGIVDIPSMVGSIDEQNGELMSGLMEEQCRGTSQLGAGGVGYIWSFSDGAHDEEWRHSVAPILADKLAEITLATDDDLEFPDDSVLPPSGELRAESIYSEGDENPESRVDSVIFEREVVGTFQRAMDENIKVENVILEVNSLRLSFNMISSDCAGAVFYSMMKCASENSNSASELLRNASSIITKWKKLLKFYLADIDDEIEVILKFEDICAESTKEFAPHFTKILEYLYDQDVIKEVSILKWSDEKVEADEADKVFVRQAETFITWLKEASEEED